MNPLIKVIRELLLHVVNRIDNGDCDLSEIEANELISTIKRCTEKDVCMSKYQACEYLHISGARFDDYVWLDTKGNSSTRFQGVTLVKERFRQIQKF